MSQLVVKSDNLEYIFGVWVWICNQRVVSLVPRKKTRKGKRRHWIMGRIKMNENIPKKEDSTWSHWWPLSQSLLKCWTFMACWMTSQGVKQERRHTPKVKVSPKLLLLRAPGFMNASMDLPFIIMTSNHCTYQNAFAAHPWMCSDP